MTKEEFLQTLASHKTSEIGNILNSEYMPSSREEIEGICRFISKTNRHFQERALRIALALEPKTALPLLGQLARNGVTADIRMQALDRILTSKLPDAYPFLLECACDENFELQRKSIQGLRGWKDPSATELLIDRVNNPTVAIVPNESSYGEEIRKTAIEALATDGMVEAITPLVTLMLRPTQHRQSIARTLVAIGGIEVIHALLNAAESTNENASPDQAFKIEAASIIAQLELKRFNGQLPRYKKLLGEVYPLAVGDLPNRKVVIEDACRRIDDQLLEVIRQTFNAQIDGNAAIEIVASLKHTDLKRASMVWMDIFETWRPHFRDVAKTTFYSIAKENPDQIVTFVEDAIRAAGQKHSANSLPDAVSKLAGEINFPILESLAVLLNEESPRGYVPVYLECIWGKLDVPKRSWFIASLLSQDYHTEEAIKEIAKFVGGKWNKPVLESQPPKIVLDLVREAWSKKNQRRQTEKVLGVLSEHIGDKSQWCNELAKRAFVDFSDKEWQFFENAFTVAPSQEQVSALRNSLDQHWHRKLTEHLLKLAKDQGAIVLRKHLELAGDSHLAGNDRIFAVLALGECGTGSDFPLLWKEVEEASEVSAVAAIKAIARISLNDAQEYLKKGLESRKSGVVLSALDALERVDDIQSDTVRAIRSRTGPAETNDAIQHKALNVLQTLQRKHLTARPNQDQPLEKIQKWLTILESFDKSQESGAALETLFRELGDREAADIRKAIAHSIAVCCLPDKGIQLVEKELATERRQEVREAWEETLDTLRALPDRGVFKLIGRVCDQTLDRSELLGRKGLEEVFLDPTETLITLRKRLQRAESVKGDPDTLVTNLDATAELFVDQLLLWAREDLEKYANQYGNKIGKLKSIDARAARHAETLHLIREGSMDPHARDSSGNLREGLTLQDADDAKKSFVGLFMEVVSFLSRKSEDQRLGKRTAKK